MEKSRQSDFVFYDYLSLDEKIILIFFRFYEKYVLKVCMKEN